MTLPPPNTTSSPANEDGPPHRSSSTSIQRSVSAHRVRSPVVGPYSARYRSRGRSAMGVTAGSIERSSDVAAEPGRDPPPAEGHELDVALDPRFEAPARPG